jgi:hypothetical protein
MLCTLYHSSRSRYKYLHSNKIIRNILPYAGLSTVWTLALHPFLTGHSHGQKRQTRYTALSLKYLHAHQMVRTYMRLSTFVCVCVSCCLCVRHFLRLSTVINYIINLYFLHCRFSFSSSFSFIVYSSSSLGPDARTM